ncbi:9720_t:CDS:2 [Rhizophagus irregularis]|nr:9720_t:CDS:2 [Rhizophagus irregularis]
MKAQEIHRMEEMNIEDRKEILSVEQQNLQPISPKEELAQQSSNDDREFERDGYQRTREEVTTQSQDEKHDIADQNESHELALVYESDPTERNVLDPYDKNSRYSEKQKNGSKIYNRKRIRSNSIHSEESYYSRPSEETPVYDSEIPPPSWHSNNRIPRKDYFNNDRKKNRMRYRNRDFNYERVQLFDRIRIKDRTRIPERERDFEIVDRKERYDRERELRIIERDREREIREREITRPRDNPTRYYEESHPRMRVPYYEYGREADRMRAPYYDYHREPDFREREYPRYREFDWDPYYHRVSSPPLGNFPYRDNMKRPNDYFYQPPIYPRRSISPRARYSHIRRSLSPNSRRLSNPTHERRYERDRPPRYDLVRDNEFERRDSIHYNAPHYSELHSPGFDHYTSPVLPPSPINMKSSYEDNGLSSGVGSNVNESYERELDNHSNSTIVSASANINNNITQDRTRDRVRNEKTRNWNSNDEDINTDHNNSGGSDTGKESYHVIREKNNKYWDDDENNRDPDRNTTKYRERDNKEREDFDQAFSKK